MAFISTSYLGKLLSGIILIEEGRAGDQTKSDLNIRIGFLGVAILCVPTVIADSYHQKNWKKLTGALITGAMAIYAAIEIHDYGYKASLAFLH